MTVMDQSTLRQERSRSCPEHAPRILTDKEGHLWRVREVCFADAAPSLIFESESGFRRVREYPHDWASLSDDELQALSWRK